MLNITQNDTATWFFTLENSIVNAAYLLVATNKCTGAVKFFNAANLAVDTCENLEFLITEVGNGGVEDLDTGKVRLNPSGGWTVDVYEQTTASTNKDPANATLLGSDDLNVFSDGVFKTSPTATVCPPCSDAVITNSDGVSTFNVASGGTGACDIATPVNTLTCQQLNDELTDAQRQLIQKVRPLPTGQTTSYATGDDGDLERGRLVNFTTLSCNNPHGNTRRFTQTDGSAVTVANNLLIQDHATGLMWDQTPFTGDWPTVIAAILVSAKGGFSWVPCNINEMLSIVLWENGGNPDPLDHIPLFEAVGGGVFIWASTTDDITNTNAEIFISNNRITRTAKTTVSNSVRTFACRYF